MKAMTSPQEVADFVLKYGDGLYSAIQSPQIEDFIASHMAYGTLLIVRTGGSIKAVCRWNWVSRNHAYVLDLIVHPDHRDKNFMKSILVKAMTAYPWLTTMSFYRKKHDREVTCLVTKFLGKGDSNVR